MRQIPILVLSCMVLAVPTAASASPCNFFCNSTTRSCVSLVGSAGGSPAAATGQFSVVFRDIANNPIAGATVVIDLSGALDLELCADQMDPDATVDCAHKTVSKVTAADGSV